MSDTPGVRRLRVVLTVLAALFLVAAFAYELAPLIGPFTGFSHRLPFVTNSVVKVAVLMMCCMYAAGNPAERLGLARIVIWGHVVSIVAIVVMILFADTSAVVSLAGAQLGMRHVLLGALILDGVLAAIVLVVYLGARGAEVRGPSWRALNPAEHRMRVLLLLFGWLFTLAALGYAAGPLIPASRDFFVQLPFVTNSVVKVGLLAMLCFYAAHDLVARLSVVGIVIAGHVVSGLAIVGMLLFADTSVTVSLLGSVTSMQSVLWGALALDGGIAVLLWLFYRATWTARYRGRFFTSGELRTLVALADVVVIGPDERVPAETVAATVDRHIANVRAQRRWVYEAVLRAMQLHPLLYLKAPFSELDAGARLHHLEVHFKLDVVRYVIPDWWRKLVQIMIRVSQQLCYVGYYNDPRTFDSVGYVRFTQRPRFQDLPIPPRGPHPLAVELPGAIGNGAIETDVCIIGSGAGGATLAYNLAKNGRDVLVLERGRYVQPLDFTEDEVDMMGKLYADGLFQQTQDYRFTILQGSCVGGSTVVNNAVCFDPPDAVVARWNDPAQHDAGLHVGDLHASTDEVRRFLEIKSQGYARLNPTGPLVERGVNETGLGGRMRVAPVEANIKDCFGCGYCNMGCAYGKKLSMLDRTLPEAQRRFPGKVRIIAECRVERLRVMSGPTSRVTEARATLGDGRTVSIRASTFVVSAGAVASSYLLLKSGIGRRLPVGQHLAFNMGAPLTAEFDSALDAYDALQIGHFAQPTDSGAYVYETWWNPPVAQAVNLPGWFRDHYENMLRYRHLAAVGLLVGTKGNAHVAQALTGGPDVVYVPDREDLRILGEGLITLGKIFFAAGARRVMANTWQYDQFWKPEHLERLRAIVQERGALALGTGHPQGGNAISRDPGRGVVGPDFRVHGYSNLYVCDASVFPTSITVNPQLTIMTLAQYASTRIR